MSENAANATNATATPAAAQAVDTAIATEVRARAGRPSSAEVVARLAAKQAARAQAAPATATPEPTAPEQTQTAPSPVSAPAADPPPTGAQQAPTDEADMRLRRAHAAVQEEKKRRLELEQRLKDLEPRAGKADEYAQLKELMGKNPAEALKRLGLDFPAFVKDVADGKVTPYSREQIEIEGAVSEMNALKSQLAELKAEREQAARHAARQERASALANELKESTDFPTLAALSWAPHRLAEIHEQQGEAADLVEIARNMEQAAMGDVRAVLSSERAIKALVSDTETRNRIVKALGLETSTPSSTPQDQQAAKGQPAASSSPRTLTNAITAAVGDRLPRSASWEERRARAIAAANRHAKGV